MSQITTGTVSIIAEGVNVAKALVDPNIALGTATSTRGTSVSAIYGGNIVYNERDNRLRNRRNKFTIYANNLNNVSIVSASIRYFLNLVNKAAWSVRPSEADTDGSYAKFVEEALFTDPLTPWHKVMRRAAMYRYFGFNCQEWTAMRRPDGRISFMDIASRAQSTIERWDVTREGYVRGVWQRSPQDGSEIYIPRAKLLYIVDDSLDDTPEGSGLARHLVEPADRLRNYLSLEGVGFETDLRGIPVGKAPLAEIFQMVQNEDITAAEAETMLKPMRTFLENHIKSEKLALLQDSQPYSATDDAQRPSNNPKWSMDLLKGSSNSFSENAAAIERINREIARILGTEQLMLGADGKGSLALSADKTNTFFLLVDSALNDLKVGTQRDLLTPLWTLNGYDVKYMPTLLTDVVRNSNPKDATAAILDLARSGAALSPEDPAINEIREELGLSESIPMPVPVDGSDAGEGRGGVAKPNESTSGEA